MYHGSPSGLATHLHGQQILTRRFHTLDTMLHLQEM